MRPRHKALVCNVRFRNGVPTLHVNGAPYDQGIYLRALERRRGCAQWTFEDVAFTHKQQYDNGVRLFLFHSTAASDFYRPEYEVWVAPDKFDYSHVEQFLEFVERDCPDALVMLKLNMFLPVWWEQQHPEELQRFADGGTTGKFSAEIKTPRQQVVSLASEQWYGDMTRCVERYLGHIEPRFGHRIVGYAVCGGITHEWGILGSYDFVDYSKPMQRYWREWLMRRYDGKPPFSTEIPTREMRLRDCGSFRNPAESRAAIDFQLCLSDLVAERIIGFCETIKRKTENRKVTATYYGYTLTAREGGLEFLGRYGCGGFQGGHLAMQKLLASPAVDIITSPFAYSNRRLGAGDLQPHYAERSVTGAGKASWVQDDNRCWKFYAHGAVDAGYYPEPENFLKQLRRSFATHLCGERTVYLQDLFGHNYDDPRVLAELSRLQLLFEKHASLRGPTLAEILFVVDEEAIAHLGLKSSLHLQSVYWQLPHLAHIGAPHHVALLRNVAKMDLSPYRFVILANSVARTPLVKNTVEKIHRNGASILFMPASGLIGKDGLSAKNASALTGINLELFSEKAVSVFAQSKHDGLVLRYGYERPISHILAANDLSAETWGVIEGTAHPALAMKPRGEGKGFSAYASIAPLPWALLGQLAAKAGCHRWGVRGEAIYYSARLLGIHINEAGLYQIRLPAGKAVQSSILPPNQWRQRDNVLELKMEQWETAVFELKTL